MKNFNGVAVYENLKEIIDPSHSCLVVWDYRMAWLTGYSIRKRPDVMVTLPK